VPDQQSFNAPEAFAELGRIKLSETNLDGVLHRVAQLAKRTIAGAEEVSVTLVRDNGAHTAAYTGQIALTLDEWQYKEGRGPCLDAAASSSTVSVPDLSGADRWPVYRRRALEAGVHSSLSVGLPVHDTVTGALNIYSAKPEAFDQDAVIVAQTFSSYAAVALANAHLYEASATLAQQMQAAMEHRAVIEQAKGILIGGRGCTSEEAFMILRKLSQDTNRKLHDVAAALVAKAQKRSSK
jgi:GAF domain-containing protein